MGIFDRFNKKKPDMEEQKDSSINSEIAKIAEEAKVSEEKIQQLAKTLEAESEVNFIRSETKFESQQTNIRRSSLDNPLTLEYIIKDLLEINPDYCGSLFIASRNHGTQEYTTQEIKDREAFLNFNPFDAILYVNDKGELLPKSGENVTLIISYRPLDIVFGESKPDNSKYNVDNSIIIFLRGFGLLAETNKTVFMRASVMIPNFIDEDDTKPFATQNIPTAKSFIFCYDITDPKERLEKFNEIKESLDKKLAEGEFLNRDEKEMLDSRWNYRTPEEFLGKGEWLFNQKRYYDALIYLKRAYDSVKKLYYKENERYMDLMPKICFYIGYCYAEAKQFDRALFYLKMALQKNSFDSAKEYISILSQTLSPETFGIVTSYIKGMQDKGDGSPEAIDFFEFLMRRIVWLYIEFENWEKAKKYLQYIKNSPNPQTRQFAENEIRYMISKGVYN